VNPETDAMPIFDYRCAECGHTFELIVQTSTVPECPRCHTQHLEKLLSRFAVGGQASAAALPASPCGQCGDPRGPGACRFDA
jgi:putative FmdB family regulatory protein